MKTKRGEMDFIPQIRTISPSSRHLLWQYDYLGYLRFRLRIETIRVFKVSIQYYEAIR